MIVPIRTLVKITVTVSLIFIAFEGLGANMAVATEKPSVVSAGKTPSGKPSENEQPSGGLFPIEAFHKVIREEREATLLALDKDIEAISKHLSEERMAILIEMENMRKTTLSYLTDERKEVMEQLIAESNRITDLLVAERQTTMLELEVTGNRIVEGALQRSEKLIDHFFIRLSQLLLVVALGLGIITWITLRLLAKRKLQAS